MTDRILGKYFRVSDPQGLNEDPDTDPDPAFVLIADPDSIFMGHFCPPGSGSAI
jgi:hypothetical protein